jgi:hypothetical protein
MSARLARGAATAKPAEARVVIERYVSVKPKRSRGAHKYSLDSVGLDEARERLADYMAHCGEAYES